MPAIPDIITLNPSGTQRRQEIATQLEQARKHPGFVRQVFSQIDQLTHEWETTEVPIHEITPPGFMSKLHPDIIQNARLYRGGY